MSADKFIESLRKDSEFLNLYTQGMSYLERSGIFRVLRELAKPVGAPANNPNFTQIMMVNTGISMGYNQALDDLYNFRDRYLTEAKQDKPEPEYGGLDIAVAKGDLTEDEVHEFRTGERNNSAEPVRKSGDITGKW